jgi:hypothetical protein
MHNPYRAPTTPLKDVLPLPPPRSPILAVLAGVAVDVGGTMAASVVIFLAVQLANPGMSPPELVGVLVEADRLGPYFTVSGAVGLGFAVLGGYVCARVARRQERRWATIAGLIICAIGVALSGGSFATAGRLLLSFAGFVLGGELGRRRNLANAREAGVASAP